MVEKTESKVEKLVTRVNKVYARTDSEGKRRMVVCFEGKHYRSSPKGTMIVHTKRAAVSRKDARFVTVMQGDVTERFSLKGSYATIQETPVAEEPIAAE